jgi:hypothetical protein
MSLYRLSVGRYYVRMPGASGERKTAPGAVWRRKYKTPKARFLNPNTNRILEC